MKDITVSQIFMIIGLCAAVCCFLVVDAPTTHSISNTVVVIENNNTWTVKSAEPISAEIIPDEITAEITHVDQISECELILHVKKGCQFNIKKWKEIKVNPEQVISTAYSGY